MKRKLINFVLVIFFLFHKSKHFTGNRKWQYFFNFQRQHAGIQNYYNCGVYAWISGSECYDTVGGRCCWSIYDEYNFPVKWNFQQRSFMLHFLYCNLFSYLWCRKFGGFWAIFVYFFAKSLYETMLTTLEYFGKILFLSSIWLILQH